MSKVSLTPIAGVAIKYDGKIYSLPKPNRHHDVIRMIAKENGVGISGPDVQGFIDQEGHFWNRRHALAIAHSFRQILDYSKVRGVELFSEDLW